MPTVSQKRPDTLELEVLGGHNESSDDEDDKKRQTKRHRKLARNQSVQPETRRRWFHFGAKKAKNTEALTTTTPLPPTAAATAAGVGPLPLPLPHSIQLPINVQRHTENVFATLAKPETTTIDNSVTTICSTPLPQSSLAAATAASTRTPDVKTKDDLQNKRRSHTQTESLYSLATHTQTGEAQLFPCSEPNLGDALHKDLREVHSFHDTRDHKLLTTATTELPGAGRTNLSSEDEDVIDGANIPPTTGLRASFMSLLGKLAFWKRSCCQYRRQRRKSRSSQATGDSRDNIATDSVHKSQNASSDFEQFGSGSVLDGSRSAKGAGGLRRLSQIRLRRSSYYFSENERRIRANDREFNSQFKYTDNYIKTSKYSMLTFLPYNLLEQFQRLANFYFLCLLVLQLIPAISSLTPVTTAIPLIGVLTLTAVKDAYDDIQRHVSDSQVNNRKSKCLRNGKLIEEKWSGVQVGDVIRLENNQFVAADILLLTTSEPNGLCFIETAELDGETNLKCKQCLPETIEMGQRHDLLWNFNGEIICERPNNLLNKFEGTLMWRNQRYSLDNEKVLLRGCVLRNTQWCYGVVIFAGKDTKLMQNSGKTQFKSTGVDRLLNFIIIGIVLFLLSICAFFTLACAIWEGLIGQHFQAFLPWENIIPKDVLQGATVIGLLVFFSYAIVLNTVVPISLYVSVEVIRFAQSFLINWDEEMYYETTKTHAKARTTTLNEELGQIQYIFSDKTGTLTQNIMTFNKCSINGRAYGDVIDLRTGEVIEVTDKQKKLEVSNGNKSKSETTLKPTITTTTSPTLLLHKAEVHPKSSILVTTAAKTTTTNKEAKTSTTQKTTAASTATPTTTANLNSLASKTTITTPTTTSPLLENQELPSNGTVPTESQQPTVAVLTPEALEKFDAALGQQEQQLQLQQQQQNNTTFLRTPRHVQYAADTRDGSPSSAITSSSCWRRSGSISSSCGRGLGLRRQTSSMSDTSDKVMIFDDKPPMATLIVSSNSHKSKRNSSFYNTTTTAITLPNRNSNQITTANSTRKNSNAADLTDAIAPLSAPTSPLQSPLSPKSTKLLRNSISKNSLQSFFNKNKNSNNNNNTQNQQPSKAATFEKKQKIEKSYNNSSFCAPFCSYNTKRAYKRSKSDLESYTNSVDDNYDISGNTTNAFKTNTTTIYTSTNKSHTNTSTTTTTINWAASNQHHRKVHALEPIDFSANPEYETDFKWYDRTLLDAVRSGEEHAHTFFRLLALCHTVMPEYVEGRLEYQAQSPDEAALVSAARNFGFVFRSRTPNSITIEVMGKTEDYELLNILDFNNVRKRMSVILRRGDDIVLYCKGADNVIYDRLSSSQNDIKARTQEHLNKFAGEGLRTLVLAERRLDLDYFNDWSQRQQEASVTMDHREDKLSAIYEEIESEMMLVGVTAIEDKLQDGVPQTIANLQMAGIKIWVLTGDKQETAINIGYSCQLLTDELADIFIVDGSSMEEVEKQLRQFKETIKILNRFRPTPLEPIVNLNLNGDRHNSTSVMHHTPSAFRAQMLPPPPPAISVVTFSAECNELYENLEKGSNASAAGLHQHDDLHEEHSGFAIVINGHSLVYCLAPELEAKFLDIASQCRAVICCRVTPLQKALVVELIKRAKNAVTLAIGDGANDVSMIKAAHIGVGISGQEGLQAVLASDYSIAQFRYLERLLLVHGRWSYYRMCKFLRYFFYKNFAFTLCHCWYSFFCGFSAQTVFDPMFISVYNLFYTSLPVLALGIFEQDVSDRYSLEFPKLYTPGLKSQLFNTREFVYSVLHGAFSSLILFLIPYGTYKEGVSADGLILSDHMTLGAVVATILIIDNTAQIALYTSYWTIFNHIMIWGSLILYFVLDYFYNYVIGGPYVGSLTQAMKDLTFWVTMFMSVTMLMAPVLAYKFYLIDVHPSLSDKILLKRRQASLRLRQSNVVLRTPSSRRARRSLRSGYAFAHQEGFGRLITSGKIMRKLPQEFAFPLGLGSKKVQSAPNDAKNNHQINNNSTKDNQNSATSSHDASGEFTITNKSEDDLSPRAPYQDLDTINL